MKSFRAVLMLIAVLIAGNANATPIDWANGHWALDPKGVSAESLEKFNCETNPINITADPSQNFYTSKHTEYEAETADILDAGSNYIQIKYRGEERTMENGELQIWNMIFLDKDKFVWVREDWLKDDGTFKGATSARVKCKAPNA